MRGLLPHVRGVRPRLGPSLGRRTMAEQRSLRIPRKWRRQPHNKRPEIVTKRWMEVDGERWRLQGGTILARRPVVEDELEQWEKEHSAWKDSLDDIRASPYPWEAIEQQIAGRSKLDFQVQDTEQGTKAKKKKAATRVYEGPGTWQVGPDEYIKTYEERMTELDWIVQDLKQQFNVTDADRNNDRHSLRRALPRQLFLVVKRKGVDKHAWMFPKAEKNAEEHMQETAARALVEQAGSQLETYFYSNRPCVHFDYRHGADYSDPDGCVGTRVFLFNADWVEGESNVVLNEDVVEDFAWITSDELGEYVEDSAQVELLKGAMPL